MLTVAPIDFSFPAGLTGRAFSFRGIGDPLSIFFAVRASDESFLATNDDAIVPYAAIFAYVHGADLDLNGMEVDPVLLRNVRCALAECARWNPGTRPPIIHGTKEGPVPTLQDGEVAVFFTGGIDSFFTALRHAPATKTGDDAVRDMRSATRAIHVYHTLEPVGPHAFGTLDSLAATAEKLGLGLVPVQTNVMEVDRLFHDHWTDMGFGATLSTIAHILSRRLSTGVIASSHSWGALVDCSSSPAIDPLWSGRRMEIVHDDARYDRVEKTALVAQHPIALSRLNVCDMRVDGRGYANCSKCPKCLRTMLTLDLFGAGSEDKTPAFDWADYTPNSFSKVFLRTESDIGFAETIRAQAEQAGRHDIAAACAIAERRGHRLKTVATLENALKATRIGRRYRTTLKAMRDRGYKAVGFATKPGVDLNTAPKT